MCEKTKIKYLQKRLDDSKKDLKRLSQVLKEILKKMIVGKNTGNYGKIM